MSGWAGSRKAGRFVGPVGQPVQLGTMIGLLMPGLSLTNGDKAMSKNIKFELAADGVIPLNIGKAGFADVLSLGALMSTYKRAYDPQKSFNRYRTDEAGLEQIIQSTNGVLETINDIINALGLLLVGDPDAINEHDLRKAGWALVGLSELSDALKNELQELHHSRFCTAQDQEGAK